MEAIREEWLILISTPVYFIIIGLEILLTHLQHKRSYTLKDTMQNLYLMLVNSGIDLAFRVVYLAILQFFFIRSVYSWSNPVVYWSILLLAEDFLYYWLHRFDHTIRLFWAVHVTHHSSEKTKFYSRISLFRFSTFVSVHLFYSVGVYRLQAD